MKLCENCQQEVDDNVNFCPNCGKSFALENDQTAMPKALIENDSPFTPETIKKYLKPTKRFGIIFFCLGLFFSLMYILDRDGFGYSMLFPCFIILVCSATLIAVPAIYAKKHNLLNEKTHNLYLFYENEAIGFGYEGQNKRDFNRIPYDKFTKIKKQDGMYLLFFGLQLWVVESNCFTVGTEEEFCAFLRRVCNPKVIKF